VPENKPEGRAAEDEQFCPRCGQALPEGLRAKGTRRGQQLPEMDAQLAAALSYGMGWVTGVIFLILDKRPFVRFHAAQSIVIFGVLNAIIITLSVLSGVSLLVGKVEGLSPYYALVALLYMGAFILWIVLMVKAYHGVKYEVPVAARLAHNLAAK